MSDIDITLYRTIKPLILIVEYEAFIAADLATTLESMGYEVCGAVTTAEQAFDAIEKRRPDLVIMNIVLQGDLDGIEAAEVIRSRWSIPVVFLTAQDHTDRFEQTKLAYPFGFLLKPFQEKELKITVKMALYVAKADEARRKAEEKLRESEERFRRLAENAQDMIYRMSLPDGNYEYVNPASIDLLGYTPEEIYEKPMYVQQAIHPDWVDYFKEQWANLLSGNMLPFYEFQAFHKSGEERWFHQRNVLVRGENGQPVAIEAIVSDITERKRTEEALRVERQRLANVIAGTNVGFMEWHVQTGETVFNELFAEILGYTLEELAPVSVQTWRDLTHPDDLKKAFEILQKHFAGELNYYDFECRMKHKNGSWVWVHNRAKVIQRTADGKPLVMAGTQTDITARKQTEETLHLFKSVIEHSEEAVGISDPRGRLVYINPAHEKLFGRSLKETQKVNYREYYPPESLALLADKVTPLLQSGKSWEGEIYAYDKSGRLFPLWERADIIRDSEGRIQYTFGLMHDITERKKEEKEKELLIENLQKALNEVKILQGFIPICAWCKNIRNDKGYWEKIEKYVAERSQAKFSHGICPDCAKKFYPEYYKDEEART
ncbi:MAG: PAS domain S-box protein [Deltaproteobacteria bacterium]|nr:PAS domain S-box protein [Deltaproteobacteria bacterium]